MRGTLNQRDAIRLLEAQGWTRTRGGKHQVKMRKKGRRPITKELPGCFAAGDTLDELLEALQEGISLCLDQEPAGPLHLASVTFTDRPLATA